MVGTNDGLLTIGENGEGSVDISSNSQFFATTTIVGQNDGSTGTLIVDDSTWGGSNLTIGSSGLATGNVTVENGSSVLLDNIAIGAQGMLQVTGLVTTTVLVPTLTLAFGTLSVFGGGEVNLNGAAGVQGAVDIRTDSLVGLGTINANVVLETGGVLDADLPLDGTLTVNGNIHGNGEIDPVRRFESNGGIDAGITIQFIPPPLGTDDGVLQLDVPRADLGTISGFTDGNTIDVKGLVFTDAVFTPGIAGAPGVLTLSGGADPPLDLNVTGNYAPDAFVATPLTNETLVTLGPACYCRGTLIRTSGGEVPVERLAIGDNITTKSGGAKPIRWIGRRSYDPRFIRKSPGVVPIRVAANALAEGVPSRELCVSPEHALYLDGVLVPARLLLNGSTVRQDAAPAGETVDYFHIELETHDIIFAESAPAETFVDCDNRGMFHNAAEFGLLYPADAPTPWKFCAARVMPGSAELCAIRGSVLARAVALSRLMTDPDLHLLADGVSVPATQVIGQIHLFQIPTGTRQVIIASRSAVPAETAAGSSDQRRLGVAVEEIVLSAGARRKHIGPDQIARSRGFHASEGSHCWTDGEGIVPAEALAGLAGDLTAKIRVAAADLHYPVDDGRPAPGASASRPPRSKSPRRPAGSAGERR